MSLKIKLLKSPTKLTCNFNLGTVRLDPIVLLVSKSIALTNVLAQIGQFSFHILASQFNAD